MQSNTMEKRIIGTLFMHWTIVLPLQTSIKDESMHYFKYAEKGKQFVAKKEKRSIILPIFWKIGNVFKNSWNQISFVFI